MRQRPKFPWVAEQSLLSRGAEILHLLLEIIGEVQYRPGSVCCHEGRNHDVSESVILERRSATIGLLH